MWNARSSQPRSLQRRNYQNRTTSNENISTIVKGAAGPPAARECVALHEAVGVEGQQLHALRQDQLACAAGARAVFPEISINFDDHHNLVPPVAGEYGGALLHQLLPHCLGVRLRQLRHILKSSRWVLDSLGLRFKAPVLQGNWQQYPGHSCGTARPCCHTLKMYKCETLEILNSLNCIFWGKEEKIFTVQWHVAYS